MTGPRPKPLPLADDEYARREEERYALQEAQETCRWDEMEGSVELAEFKPVSADVERVERDTDYMLAREDLKLYSEWGRVY